MAAPLYTRLEATARRLIASYGKDGAIVREERTGPPHAPVVTPVAHPCKLVDTGYSITNRDGTHIQTGDKVGIISTDAAVAPQMDDRIRIDGEDYRFVDLQPLNPGGLTILFEYVARA